MSLVYPCAAPRRAPSPVGLHVGSVFMSGHPWPVFMSGRSSCRAIFMSGRYSCRVIPGRSSCGIGLHVGSVFMWGRSSCRVIPGRSSCRVGHHVGPVIMSGRHRPVFMSGRSSCRVGLHVGIRQVGISRISLGDNALMYSERVNEERHKVGCS